MNLLGHNKNYQIFKNAFDNNRLHHAWLLHGRKGIGKATLTTNIANYILNNKANFHPDLLKISLNHEHKQISINDIRRGIDFLHLTPSKSKYKLLIIDSIDDLTNNAANSLLKILEEPPTSSIIILVCHVIGRILPTIKSRCRLMHFCDLNAKDFIHILEHHIVDLAQDIIDNLYKKSFGSVGIAIQIYNNNLLEILNDIDTLIESKSLKALLKMMNNVVGMERQDWQIISNYIQLNMQQKIKQTMLKNDSELAMRQLNFYGKVKDILHKTELLNLDQRYCINYIFG